MISNTRYKQSHLLHYLFTLDNVSTKPPLHPKIHHILHGSTNIPPLENKPAYPTPWTSLQDYTILDSESPGRNRVHSLARGNFEEEATLGEDIWFCIPARCDET